MVTVGLLITRVATVALTITGMSLEQARFQARSAFTGTGFTTSEAEAVVGHPARRRIVMTLMLVSGAGAVSVLGTLILTFARNPVVDRALRRVIERLLRRVTDLDSERSRALHGASPRSEPLEPARLRKQARD